MDATIYLHYISLLFLVLIAFSGLMMVFGENRKFGWGIFLAFALFAFYELVGLLPPFGITEEILSIIFFVATLIMLMTVMSIGMEKMKKGKKKDKGKK